MLKRKYNITKTVFSVLMVFVVCCTFAINIFAFERPSFFSSGYSYDGDYIYSGNNDVSVTLGVSYPDSDNTVDFSTLLNPSFSYDMVMYDSTSVSYDIVSPFELGYINISNTYSDFECSNDYFISGIASDNSYFGSDFLLTYSDSDGYNYLVNYVKISANNFYFYLDPNDEIGDPYYDDCLAESFINMYCMPHYDGAEGSIYYCLAGEEDDANNRKIYNYSLTAAQTTTGNTFSTLPSDQSFSGQYSEPTLIYVEYFEFVVPLVQQYSLDGYEVSGVYVNYNMNYRSIDISSYEEPISPINPGIFRDYTSWLGSAVGGFLDLQLVDGFTLGGILMVLIAFMMTMWFLKVYAGG